MPKTNPFDFEISKEEHEKIESIIKKFDIDSLVCTEGNGHCNVRRFAILLLAELHRSSEAIRETLTVKSFLLKIVLSLELLSGILEPTGYDGFELSSNIGKEIKFMKRYFSKLNRKPYSPKENLPADKKLLEFLKWRRDPNHSAEDIEDMIDKVVNDLPLLLKNARLDNPSTTNNKKLKELIFSIKNDIIDLEKRLQRIADHRVSGVSKLFEKEFSNLSDENFVETLKICFENLPHKKDQEKAPGIWRGTK